jgi:hypothetical protein
MKTCVCTDPSLLCECNFLFGVCLYTTPSLLVVLLCEVFSTDSDSEQPDSSESSSVLFCRAVPEKSTRGQRKHSFQANPQKYYFSCVYHFLAYRTCVRQKWTKKEKNSMVFEKMSSGIFLTHGHGYQVIRQKVDSS